MRKSQTFITALALASLSAILMAADAPTSQPADQKKVTPSGLTIIEKGGDKVDPDTTAAPGDQVWVEYEGRLQNGTVFDSSKNHPDSPLIFTLGKHAVIAGWDEGIAGMKVGEKRELIIPPNLAYGDQAVSNGAIPANSTLTFDLQLIGMKKSDHQ